MVRVRSSVLYLTPANKAVVYVRVGKAPLRICWVACGRIERRKTIKGED